jgi:hypothetical protein
MRVAQSSRVAWVIFTLWLTSVVAGFILWTAMAGVSWWTSPNKGHADRVLWWFLTTALVSCIVAPFFSPARLPRGLLFSGLAAVAVVLTYYLCAFTT